MADRSHRAAPVGRSGPPAPDLLESLAIVQRLARRLSGVFDLASIGDQVVSVLTQELGLHSCSIMLRAADRRCLVNLAGAGAATVRPGEAPRSFDLGEGIAGAVALGGQAIRVNDTRRDPRFLDRSPSVRSLLCFPLFSGDQVIGVLNLSHPHPRFFTTEHEAVFVLLATVVGQLLAFARVQSQLEDLNRSLETKVEAKTKEIEAAQRRSFQQEKLASLGTLVAGVAHELNNKLVPLVAYSHMLNDPGRPEDERRLIAAMAAGADGAKAIVQSLLRFSRPEPINLSVVNCNAVVEGVTALLPLRASRPEIEVRTALSPEPALVWGDAQQLEQVLVNLINNGYDAIETQGAIEIATRSRGRTVELAVSDNGQGIPSQHLSKIFDPFFTTKEVGRGTGLGLSLCYGMVRAHRGEIDVETRPGRTVFTIRLPAAEPDAGARVEQTRTHAG
ncbi:MAG: ATP-binding protein [Nitrospirota bacterium]